VATVVVDLRCCCITNKAMGMQNEKHGAHILMQRSAPRYQSIVTFMHEDIIGQFRLNTIFLSVYIHLNSCEIIL
jgi:hypothetical protein